MRYLGLVAVIVAVIVTGALALVGAQVLVFLLVR